MSLLLALLVTTAEPAAPPAITLPEIPDIQFALEGHWIKISSSGYSFHDYAIRNLDCVNVPLVKDDKDPAKDGPFDKFADKPVAQAKCAFEVATVEKRKTKRNKSATFGIKPRQFSEREIKRIPENRWRREEREFVRVSRTVCQYMGRTPSVGECDDYWAVFQPTDRPA